MLALAKFFCSILKKLPYIINVLMNGFVILL
jgi:hypothetical protein